MIGDKDRSQLRPGGGEAAAEEPGHPGSLTEQNRTEEAEATGYGLTLRHQAIDAGMMECQ